MKIITPLVATLATTATLAANSPVFDPALPAEHHEGVITYRSGGIGENESHAMRRAATHYPLEVLFVSRNGSRDEYLADVPLTIKDARGHVVFTGQSDGPYFLARLPQGHYVIASREGGLPVTRAVTIAPGASQRVVFEWKSAHGGSNA